MMKMKALNIFFAVLSCMLVFSGVYAQTEEAVMLTSVKTETPVSRMVWNETGTVLTLVSKDSVQNIAVSSPAESESYTLGEKSYMFITVSEAGVVAALSDDWKTIYIYDPESPEKDVKSITPGFNLLSVSVF